MSLDSATQALWNEYVALEDRGTREDRTAALARFVAAAKGLPPEITDALAYDLARRKVDGNEDFALRMPLFREIIFPALKRGIAAGRGDCGRWLAGLYQLVVRSADYLEIQAAVGSERELLVRALELDPADKESHRRLIECDANYLHFTLHELPSGVLCGMDGATPDECLRMSGFVDEFECLTKTAGVAEDYCKLIERCRLHYRAYREYLLERSDPDYATFLERNGLAE